MLLTREGMHTFGASAFLENHRYVECHEQMWPWPCNSEDRKVTSGFIDYRAFTLRTSVDPTTPVEGVRPVLLSCREVTEAWGVRG